MIDWAIIGICKQFYNETDESLISQIHKETNLVLDADGLVDYKINAFKS